ncbi:undecaprenyldiphospho-muramoylpentapeptide beta-N-acetylglucosaminyltransferase [Longibacter salinarum]|uniref:UDP-N-acetylglucosamine--N-acetylmuramyl-(pentapeptide) pyrophosphoryl-undecaprenol N-acetylglucosamine transferase n=1 Tax=Longibacter salinarum TaxID=1850348 RepID=A0A2A8CX26_9BACT|nr:undecaprenyldiphospho-muramoylpentapeptide beta-N-acetylglucosaminyltransferase [Longibacter salinarum]PEN13255.1 undecaprenyldiphospho-muramoylpentapeptide beta-N-acetylglucosaminyltransferase [Longibacter salinarum]
MPRPPHILIAGGGTGGHVYPAIAIADAIKARRPEARVVFAGTKDRLEATAVPQAGYALHHITVSGFQRDLSVRNLRFPIELAKGLIQSWRLVGAIEPDVAVGTGGYVSGPVLLAAWLRRRPIVIQEQNAYAGVTNRLLSMLASRIHLAFDEARDWVPADRAVVSGNPTRAQLVNTDLAKARDVLDIPDDAHVLLAFGGSLGSEALNSAMEQHIDALLDDPAVHVLWQTGSQYYDALSDRVAEHPRLHLMKYIDRMEVAYAAADLVLCRAGAITCSELMVTGTPSILVPSPNVVADHQTKNARAMERVGAARVLPEPNLTDRLIDTVRELLDDPEARCSMAEAARHEARPEAADRIADDVLALADTHRHR